jgi:hypothetical protein
VRLEWRTVYPPNFLEYRIYRGTESGVYDPQKLTPDGFVDSVFIDSTVQNNQTYYYVITSVNTLGLEGGYSNEASVNTGQPHTPTGLTATAGNAEIQLDWDPHPEPDIYGYIIYKAENPDSFAVLDTSQTNSYLDVGLTNGLDYYYYITAIDSFQNVSFNSDTVSAYPMGLDSGILLVNGNIGGSINPDYDSMLVFYGNILQNYQHVRRDGGIEYLTELAPYSTVVFGKESITGGLFTVYNNHNIYRRYLDAGGNIIVVGSRQMAPNLSYQGLLEYNPPDFQYEYLNLAAAYYPDLMNSIEFSGGSAVSPYYGDFMLDSARTDRIVIPPGMPYGRYPGICVLTPLDSSEVIYNYVSADPDTSLLHGRPIGIVHQTDTYKRSRSLTRSCIKS